jgi:hypothetical protein
VGRVGVDLPLGSSPLAIRLQGEVGHLVRFLQVSGIAQLVIGIGRPAS